MSIPLAWMNDDRARLLGDAEADDPQLVDVAELIVRGQTLHLIGHEDHSALSPLIGALIAEIAHAARQLASVRPGGRLDPPLTMVLDEAALVAPVPLDRWTADIGGRGVSIHISVQSLSQLRQRWGDSPAGTILANVATFLVFGGSPSAGDLRDISLLTGEHRARVVGVDSEDPRNGHRWAPALSPAQIRALEPGQVLVMRRGLHTVVGWAPKVTQRRGWRPVTLIRHRTPVLAGDTSGPADDTTPLDLDDLVAGATPPPPSGSLPNPAKARLASAIRHFLLSVLFWSPR